MKKIYLFLFFCIISAASFGQNRWSVALQFAGTGNHSKFSGGMSDASALFNSDEYGAGQLGVYFRYRINERFSFQTGFDWSEIGFNYSLAKNYSLLKPKEHFATLQTGTCISRLPAIIIYNSKLNCRHFRFIAGAGFTLEGIDDKWESESNTNVNNDALGNSKTTFMTEHTRSTQSSNASFTWLIGTEKVFKKGNMLSFTLQGNHGFNTIAESTVEYTANDKEYSHTFVNSGTFCGLAITYYFQPIGSRRLSRLNQMK